MPGLDANTKLLIHANRGLAGTEYALYKLNDNAASTTVVDSGSGANNGTASGNTSAVASDGKVSGKFGQAGVFNGTSGYLTVPDHADWNYGSGNFTIDFWVRFINVSGPTRHPFYSHRNTGDGNDWLGFRYIPSSTRTQFFVYSSSSLVINLTNDTWAPVNNVWYHLALVRNSNTFTIYVNGAYLTSTTYAGSMPDPTGVVEIGRSVAESDYASCEIDEYRISKGIARWTANFTPPTAPYASDSYTKLLLHLDNAINDDGATLHSVTNNSVGYGGFSFNGTTQYVNIDALESDIAADTKGTISLWVRANNNSVGQFIFSMGDTSDVTHLSIFLSAGTGIRAAHQVASSANWVVTAPLPSNNTWCHVVLVQDGIKPKLYFNGVDLGVFTTTTDTTKWMSGLTGADNGRLGCLNYNNQGNIYLFTGVIDDVRYYRNVALGYDAVQDLFNAAANNYGIVEKPYAQYWMNENAGNTTVLDSGIGANNGTASTNTSSLTSAGKISKFSAVGHFNGTTSYLTVPDHADWNFGTGDFTIDFWAKAAEVSGVGLIGQQTGAGTFWNIDFTRSGTRAEMYWYSSSSELAAYSADFSFDENWHHWAFVRNGANGYIFRDGVSLSTRVHTAFGATSLIDYTGALSIGNRWSTDHYFRGALDEIRISKGIARWTADFTPPSSAYTSDSYTKLLLHLNENVTDSGNTGHTVTNNGMGYGSFGFNGSSYNVNLNSLAADIATDTQGTICFWINSSDSDGTVFSIGDDSDANAGAYIEYYGTGGYINMIIGGGATNPWHAHTPNSSVPQNTWCHVAIVQDGVAPRIYVNGVSQTLTYDYSGTKGAWFNYYGAVLDVARLAVNRRNGTDSLWLVGYVDDFRYYKNQALSQAAVQAIYAAGAGTESSMFTGGNGIENYLIKDESNYNANTVAKFITPYGDTLISTAVADQSNAKLASGGGFAELGPSKYLSVADSADWDFGSGDFTVELWAYIHSIPKSGYEDIMVIRRGSSVGYPGWLLRVTENAAFDVSAYNSTTLQFYLISSSAVVTPARWNHFALVRNGNTVSLYFNGTSCASTSYSGTLSDYSNGVEIGIWTDYASITYHNGYIDEFCISKGIARYTGTFTPSVRLTADSYTKLLLHFDSDVTTDSETTPKTVTNNGSVTWRAGSKWGGGSLMFDGTGDYLSVPDSTDWDIVGNNTDNYTIDFQAVHTNYNGSEVYCSQGTDVNNAMLLYCSGASGYFYFLYYIASTEYGIRTAYTGAISGGWHHLALIRTGSYMGLYSDGAQVGYSWSPNIITYSGPLLIGQYGSGSYFEGNIDEFRVQKSNYFLAAPNSFPAAALLTYSGGELKSCYGSFNGSSSYISFADSDDWNIGASAFTLDLRIRFKSWPAEGNMEYFYSHDLNSSNFVWFFIQTSSGNHYLGYRFREAGSDMGFGSKDVNLSLNTWYHVAFVHVSGSSEIKVYVDGTRVGTLGFTERSINIAAVLEIGRASDNGSSPVGYIDADMEEYRLSNVARWTTDFTPPTAPYCANGDSNTKLLIHFDGGSSFGDASPYGHGPTRNNVDKKWENWGYGGEGTLSDNGIDGGAVGGIEFFHYLFNDNAASTTVIHNGNAGSTFDATASTNTSNLTTTGKINGAFNFNGSSDYVSLNASVITYLSDDTVGTVSLWFKADTINTFQSIFSYADASAVSSFMIGPDTDSKLHVFFTNIGTTKWEIRTAATLSTGVWYHVVVVHDGVSPKLYLNGQDVTNLIDTTDTTWWFADDANLDNIRIGCRNQNSGGNATFFDGIIDDFRYYSQQALAPFQILKIYNAGNGTEEKMHAGYFNNSSDYAVFADASGSDYDMAGSTADSWTFDGWFLTWDLSTNRQIYEQTDATPAVGERHQMFINGSGALDFRFQHNAAAEYSNADSAAGLIKTNRWYHLTGIVHEGHTGCYINGVQVAYVKRTWTDTFTGNLYIGYSPSTAGYYFNGYMEQVQMTHANKFGTVPCPVPYFQAKMNDNTTTTTVVDSGSGANNGTLTAPVTLQCNFNGADGATAYTAETGQVATFFYNAQLDTADKKYGSAAALFDSVGDRITFPTSANWQFGTGNFTIACWAKFNSLPAGGTKIICAVPYSNEEQWACFYDVDTKTLGIYSEVSNVPSTGSVVLTYPTALATGVWYHLAVVRDAGVVKSFVNGVLQGSAAFTSTFHTFANDLNVGTWTSASGAESFDGWMDDLIIIKGSARWVESFTPPTSEATLNSSNYVSVPGKLNTAFRFAGAADYITLDALAADIASDTTGSISFWYNTKDHTSNAGPFSFFDTAAPGTNFMFMGFDLGGRLSFQIQTSGNYAVIYGNGIGYTSWTENVWRHVVITQNGSASGLKMYVDGVDVTVLYLSGSYDGSEWFVDVTSGDSARLARTFDGSGYYDGMIDDFRYYQGQALTAEQVKVIYNAGVGTEEISVFTNLPSANITQNTITVPTKEYGIDAGRAKSQAISIIL